MTQKFFKLKSTNINTLSRDWTRGFINSHWFSENAGCKDWRKVETKISTVTLADRARSKNVPRDKDLSCARNRTERTCFTTGRPSCTLSLSLSLHLCLPLVPRPMPDLVPGTGYRRGWSGSPREEAAASRSRRNAMKEKPAMRGII